VNSLYCESCELCRIWRIRQASLVHARPRPQSRRKSLIKWAAREVCIIVTFKGSSGQVSPRKKDPVLVGPDDYATRRNVQLALPEEIAFASWSRSGLLPPQTSSFPLRPVAAVIKREWKRVAREEKRIKFKPTRALSDCPLPVYDVSLTRSYRWCNPLALCVGLLFVASSSHHRVEPTRDRPVESGGPFFNFEIKEGETAGSKGMWLGAKGRVNQIGYKEKFRQRRETFFHGSLDSISRL